jgi:hypothetical protein
LLENGTREEMQKYIIENKGVNLETEEGKEFVRNLISKSLKQMAGGSRENMELHHYFLNTGRYGDGRTVNPLTKVYLKAAKEGKLRDSLVRFWRFDYYMYCCGRFYEIVGTAPQDGEHKDVLKVLTVAKSVLEAEIKGRYDEDDEEENEE